MARTFLHSRIETTVQETSLDCPGSITLPKEVMARADILPTEQVYVVNKTTGARFPTYAIEGEKVCLNGGAARLAMPGDALIIMTFQTIDVPKLIRGVPYETGF